MRAHVCVGQCAVTGMQALTKCFCSIKNLSITFNNRCTRQHIFIYKSNDNDCKALGNIVHTTRSQSVISEGTSGFSNWYS